MGRVYSMSPKFQKEVDEMNEAILDCLDKTEDGFVRTKFEIAYLSGVPEEFMQPLLKHLREMRKIILLPIMDEKTGKLNGSGYCLIGKGDE